MRILVIQLSLKIIITDQAILAYKLKTSTRPKEDHTDPLGRP